MHIGDRSDTIERCVYGRDATEIATHFLTVSVVARPFVLHSTTEQLGHSTPHYIGVPIVTKYSDTDHNGAEVEVGLPKETTPFRLVPIMSPLTRHRYPFLLFTLVHRPAVAL